MTGTCNMTFSLWSAESGGDQQGFAQNFPVTVANGLFTVVLNGNIQFGASAFYGQECWPQTQVQCPGDCTVTLTRQLLTAVPFARFSVLPWRTR